MLAFIGGFRLGLEQAGHECVGYVEFDKYARKSYEAIHDTKGEWTKNDITDVTDREWRELRGSVNIVAGGSPCPSFSIAGKRLGFEDTRGTLFFQYANAVKQIQPDYFIFENVKGLVSHDKGKTIRAVLSTFDEIGYAVDFDILNSKHYGVPQNRERIFIVGKRKDLVINTLQIPPVGKKTLDKIKQWANDNVQMISMLPENKQLNVTTKLKDILEQEVDEKFFLTQEKADRLLKTVNHDKETTSNDIKPLNDSKKIREQIGFESVNRFYDTEGISPCLNTMSGGGREPKIMVREATNQGVMIGASRGRNPDNPSDRRTGSPTEQRLEINQDGVSNTLTTVQKDNYVVQDDFRIRKLTPLETWRLQGFPDEAFRAAEQVNSNSQLYKQAGNSVTVNVIEAIAKIF